jgi:NAD(P) transhydrogenase subunit beta
MTPLAGRELFIQSTYVLASIAFIVGLRGLTQPDKARRGMQIAALGMLLAIIGTLVSAEILTYKWIALGLGVGAVIGYPLGMWVPMTAMPQRIAIAQTFGALAATLVGVAEYHHAFHGVGAAGLSGFKMAALGI